MDPDSNFIRMINRPEKKLAGDLSVVAGDAERSGILGNLKVAFADLFYLEQHDLVVNTKAMIGGPIRENGRYFFHKGAKVSHSNYFVNERTALIVQEALTAPEEKLGEKGFKALDDPEKKLIAEFQRSARSQQKPSSVSMPVVYILPGIMGTHLMEEKNLLWLNVLALARGGLAALQIDNSNIHPFAGMESLLRHRVSGEQDPTRRRA